MNKKEKIRSLIEMQKRFIEEDRKGKLTMKNYFIPDKNSPLENYAKQQKEIAMEIVDEAHDEVGSHR